MIHACNAHWWMTRNRIHVFDKESYWFRDFLHVLYLKVLFKSSSQWPFNIVWCYQRLAYVEVVSHTSEISTI